jgi:microsomal dipeptidase-like Zn-dependent dipeptidase
MARILSGLAALLLFGGAIVFFFVLPARVDASRNRVVDHTPFAVSASAREFQRSLRVADLHNDFLLWDRDLLKRHARGHSDLPRLREGGFRVQVFSAVTKVPSGLNYSRNAATSDTLTPLVIAQRWPIPSWTSLKARALHIARRLDRAALRSNGALRVVRTNSDLDEALQSGALAGVLATEGAHPLEGKISTLAALDDAGYRIIGLHHFFDNELGGSLHGVERAGLTPFGEEVVIEAERRRLIIDVAHSSEESAWDVLRIANRPLLVSHTGLKGACDTPRNFPDDLMKAIADRGGLIGVGFWDAAVCEATPDGVAKSIVYAVKLLGPDHVALGSDYDGATTVPFDASEMAILVDRLLAAGLDRETIAKVMGENQIRFLREQLPSAS